MTPRSAADGAVPATRALADRLRALAARVAQAHAPLDDGSMVALVSGSTVEGLVDERSDVDMSIVFGRLPAEPDLRAACARVGGPWTWQLGELGDLGEGSAVVAFQADGVEVQIAYARRDTLVDELDELLLRHNPDTPLHKLAEGLLKAEPLAGAETLAAWQARLAAFPDALAVAMVRHALATPMPWRIAGQLLQRDAGLWCRELIVEACWRLLLALCGLNRRYFTRFQFKRQGLLASRLAVAPADLAARLDALLQAPPRRAFEQLHELEGEVLSLIAQHRPEIDLSAARQRWALGPGTG